MSSIGSLSLDTNKENGQIGLVSTRGGIVTLDEPFIVEGQSGGEACTYIHISVGGNLMLEMMDGSINPYLGLLDGDYVVAKAARVLTAATLGGVPYTTTATGITWHGGQ